MFDTATAAALRHKLLGKQNPDGGWGFGGKTSWTEPTAFAVLALNMGEETDAVRRAGQWLLQSQRADGGWSPQPHVDVSTWVTSLATLALLPHDWAQPNRQRAFNWLQKQVKPPESLLVQILARWNRQPRQEIDRFGSSWYPGTAAWVTPTAITVLTFLQIERSTGDNTFHDLARKGQAYLLAHRCPDGGWNHGGSRLGNERPSSYPETTGLALLALQGVPASELTLSLERGRALIADPLSGEGLWWLELGLRAHGLAPPVLPKRFPDRSPRETALQLLAISAADPRNILLSTHNV